MSTRLASGGRLIDRSKAMEFTFNGKRMTGYAGGDTLAAALLGAGQTLVGRSFKYHRPRGIVASGSEEPNALVHLGEGARFEPDQRVTTTELFDGLTCTSQNHWPSLEFDVGAINNKFARFLTAGFYYKTFMFPRVAWEKLFEPIVRQSAGLGSVPKERDVDRYEHFYAHVDVLVVGGGVAGLAAARSAASTGAKVLLIEQTAHWGGGRAVVDGGEVDGMPVEDWVNKTVEELENMANVTIRTRIMGAGVYDHAMPRGGMNVWPTIRRATDGHATGCGGSAPSRLFRPPGGRLNGRCPSRATTFPASCWPVPCATISSTGGVFRSVIAWWS